MRRVCVVVPVYKAEPDALEAASLAQATRILGNYPMLIVTHPGLELAAYRVLCPQAQYVFFERRFFESIDGYNELMLSHGFYEQFSGYEYMLIYQPDAWVFRDELVTWCDHGFDYVGGLWVEVDSQGDITGGTCGNGGLSLRKVSTFLTVTREGYRVKGLTDLVSQYLHYRGGSWFYFLWYLITLIPKALVLIGPRLLGYRNTYGFFCDEDNIGEDRIFVHKILCNRHYRVPGLSLGYGFSWELQLTKLWERYGTLPFGCHAWSRPDYFGERVLDFWKDHIPHV